MGKLDLKKEYPLLYKPTAKRVTAVELPAFNFLMVDGEGEPESESYAEAVQALFSVSYASKFAIKRGPQAIDYTVMPLEGLWWAEDMSVFERTDRSKWLWTMMILQPDCVSEETIESSVDQLRRKKKLAGLDRLRFERFHEGLCAQILHVGPFAEEGSTVQKVHAFIDERGALRGKHHEIYLSDIRRAAPAKWRTVIRQPMQP